MRRLNASEPQFPADQGAADPAVTTALAAYAAGRGSEQAALTALAASRLLVPVVAVAAGEHGGDETAPAGDGAAGPGTGLRREKTTEMALPTLIGRDGRAAVLAFTCLDALRRWRPDARPVPVPAGRAWLAGAEEASAVVIDVAGPVPLAVEGARLAALAAGRPVPLPHQDPDVLAALRAALASEPLIGQASLTTPGQLITDPPEPDPDWPMSRADTAWLGAVAPGGPAGAEGPPPAAEAVPAPSGAGEPDADLALRVTMTAGCDSEAALAAVRRVVDALLTATSGRLRRGIAVSITPQAQG